MNLDLYLSVFAIGVVFGVGLSIWFCRQISRLRGPGYYRRRARRVERGFLR